MNRFRELALELNRNIKLNAINLLFLSKTLCFEQLKWAILLFSCFVYSLFFLLFYSNLDIFYYWILVMTQLVYECRWLERGMRTVRFRDANFIRDICIYSVFGCCFSSEWREILFHVFLLKTKFSLLGVIQLIPDKFLVIKFWLDGWWLRVLNTCLRDF